MTQPPSDPLVLTIPANQLFWAHVSDAGSFHPGRLASQAEHVLPVDIDTLHHRWFRVPNRGGWVMAGIEPERLRNYLRHHSQMTPQVWALIPTSIPTHLPPVGPEALHSFNLLSGPFEPEGCRRIRSLTLMIATIGILLTTLLVLIGIERHRSRWMTITHAVGERMEQRLSATVPGDARIPADQRLVMALRRAEAAAGINGTNFADAPALMQQLLGTTPRDMRLQTESLRVAGDRITWRVRVPDLAQAERLHQSCSPLQTLGFRLQPLQAQQADGSALAVIDLIPLQLQP